MDMAEKAATKDYYLKRQQEGAQPFEIDAEIKAKGLPNDMIIAHYQPMYDLIRGGGIEDYKRKMDKLKPVAPVAKEETQPGFLESIFNKFNKKQNDPFADLLNGGSK